ncbi:hypothetical protein CAP36_13730 [Chitinophagaceae bacterium IBVUCB2]|nr:hypothetical protein CAP36_13730 [Chitinophagaceae bacterium IBVUCB2]
MRQSKKISFLLILLPSILNTPLKLAGQEVDQIVKKHVAAMGGQQKLDSLNTLTIEGTFRIEAYELPLKAYLYHNIGQRFDVTVLKTPGFIIVTPKNGWQYFPFQGMKEPQPMKAEETEIYLSSLDLQGPLFNYKEKGHAITYEGLEVEDDLVCYKLKIILKSGQQIRGFVDTVSNYLVKTIITISSNEKGQIISENMFGNFQKTPEGYIIPYALTLGPGKMFIRKLTINSPLNSSVFDPVAAKKSEF